MKPKFFIVALFLLSLPSLAFSGVEEAKVTDSFELIVESFNSFFQNTPILIEKQKYDGSPSGYIFFYVKIFLKDLSFNILKTNSLVSPYSGYIEIDYFTKESKNCGNLLLSELNERCFSALEELRRIANKGTCFKIGMDYDNIRFNFSYQKGNWVFKNASKNTGYPPNPGIMTALGKPSHGRFPVADNQHWQALIKNK